MLRPLIFCLFMALAPFVWAQPHASVDSTTHNFGTVLAGTNPSHTFIVKNTGNAPLIINSVEPACGCIVANFTHEPISPGKSGTIVLVFSSESRRGFQLRSTTVTTNADNPEVVLYMKGTITKRR
jgi:hypothetical protein